MHSDVVESVSIGLIEDWFWTAESAYEDSRIILDFDDKDLLIGGIDGSIWATPTMLITYKDGRTEYKDCFVGESTSGMPASFQLGVLSMPCQERIDNDRTPKLEKK